MSFTFRPSVLFTRVSFFSLRMRPGFLVPSRWRLPECMRRILPPAVTLKRLAAPRCVFSFFFGFDAFLGIAKSSLRGLGPVAASMKLLRAEKRPPRKAAATVALSAILHEHGLDAAPYKNQLLPNYCA